MQLTENNAQILERCLNAVDTHNLDPLPTLYSPTAQIDAPGAELRGTDQVVAWYGVFVRAFPDIKHEVHRTVQEADTCVLQVHPPAANACGHPAHAHRRKHARTASAIHGNIVCSARTT